jgi:hypothetical protein
MALICARVGIKRGMWRPDICLLTGSDSVVNSIILVRNRWIMALEKELETYKRELPTLAASSAGKFVLIQDSQVMGVFDTYADALKEGYEKFGLTPFLVKQINALEKVHYFTRDIGVCLS